MCYRELLLTAVLRCSMLCCRNVVLSREARRLDLIEHLNIVRGFSRLAVPDKKNPGTDSIVHFVHLDAAPLAP